MGEMRMTPPTLADVTGYTYLINGHSAAANETLPFKPGENAAAVHQRQCDVFMILRIPGLKMIVIAADGSPVQPVPVDEFRMGIGETYDVVVIPDATRPIRSSPSRSTARVMSARRWPRARASAEIPQMHPRALLSMADMGAMPGMGSWRRRHGRYNHGATAETWPI